MMTWIYNFAKILYPYLVWDFKSLNTFTQLIYLFLYSHYLAYILKSVFWPNTKPNKKKDPFSTFIDLYFALVDGTYPVNSNRVKLSIIEHVPITKHFSIFFSFFNQIE
jgi:hypothetical protein